MLARRRSRAFEPQRDTSRRRRVSPGHSWYFSRGFMCLSTGMHFFNLFLLRLPRGGGSVRRDGVMLHARSLMGGCNGEAIIDRISVGIGRNRVMNLLKPGNTNGAASFCVAMNLVAPGRNHVFLSSLRVAGCPICGHTRANVNCLTRRTSMFHRVDIRSGVTSILRVAGGPGRCRGRGLRDLVTRFHLRGIHGGGKGRLSKKRHHHARVTHYLTVSPGFVVLSRPFTKMSPVTMRSVRRVI